MPRIEDLHGALAVIEENHPRENMRFAYPVEDDTPLPHLPPAGCSLFQARPHLFDPREQARDAANDVLDTCTDLAGAKSFEDVTRAAHELRRAAQLLRASAAVLERICARARGEK
jgi:hypothetical protein